MAFTEQYDVAVIGAGHAGCEAAMAAARMGLKTALITMNLDLIAQMSCTPRVGGDGGGRGGPGRWRDPTAPRIWGPGRPRPPIRRTSPVLSAPTAASSAL